MRIRFAFIFAIACFFFAFANEGRNRCLAAHLVAPENQAEIILSYPSNQGYQLNCKDGSTASKFDVYVDRNRTGHLQSRQIKDLARYLKDDSSLKMDWVDRTSFKSEAGWTQLTLSHAKQFWGEPRKHFVSGHEFYSFDAQSDWNGEANIYHLDLEFVMSNQIKAYRIRGIGIQNPKWINEDSLDAVPKKGRGAGCGLLPEYIEQTSYGNGLPKYYRLAPDTDGAYVEQAQLQIDANGQPTFHLPSSSSLKLSDLVFEQMTKRFGPFIEEGDIHFFLLKGWNGKMFRQFRLEVRFSNGKCSAYQITGPGISQKMWQAI